MWPQNFNCSISQPVLLVTPPMFQPSPLSRYRNIMPNFPPPSPRFSNTVQKSAPKSSSIRNSAPAPAIVDEEVPSASSEDLIEAFKKFEGIITEKVNDLAERTRKMERRVITTIGLNIDEANRKYSHNVPMFLEFKAELEEELSHLEANQKKLLSIMQCGMIEIKSALGVNQQLYTSSGDFKINPVIMQLCPKFDETFKNNPISFLKNFETFVKDLKITPAEQRLLFIYAAQLDHPTWRENLADNDTYEGLKKPFLHLTWSRKHQTRVYLEFEKCSFKDLSPEQINVEVKKWCNIVQNMDNLNFRHFRISLMEKLPRNWQTTLGLYVINDFPSLIRHIDLCLDNESVIPTVPYVCSTKDGF